MVEVIITEEDLQKEYKSARGILIGGIILLIIGLILFMILVTIYVLIVLIMALGFICMGPIRMHQIKSNPEKIKRRMAKQKKFKKRAKKMAKMQ